MQEILNEKLITDVEAREILSERKKEIELGYEQKNSLEHLKKYNILTPKKLEELLKKLSEVKKLKERQIISMVNMLPKDNDDLRLILEKDYTLLTEEEKNLILEAINKFA
jgi:DNA-directed RNA polymerase subunit F